MVDRATMTRVLAVVAQAEVREAEAIAAALRAEIDGLIVSTCDDDDICGVRPLAETPGVNLYLLSSSGACLGLTRDPEMAIGVVLAQITADED